MNAITVTVCTVPDSVCSSVRVAHTWTVARCTGYEGTQGIIQDIVSGTARTFRCNKSDRKLSVGRKQQHRPQARALYGRRPTVHCIIKAHDTDTTRYDTDQAHVRAYLPSCCGDDDTATVHSNYIVERMATAVW